MLNRFEEAMEKIDGMEKKFETKLDNRFNELLARLPPPPPAAPNVIGARVSRSFDEMITIDLVETTLTIRLQTCTMLRLSNH